MNVREEKILRENVQQIIQLVKKKRIAKEHLEENKLRGIIKKLADVEYNKLEEEKRLRNIIGEFLKVELMALTEGGIPDDKPTPNKSTGINVLEDLLKKIIPVIEIDFRQLTTDEEQRKSYRAHIVNAVVTTLTPVEINTAAGDEEGAELEEAVEFNAATVSDAFENFGASEPQWANRENFNDLGLVSYKTFRELCVHVHETLPPLRRRIPKS